MRKIFPFIFILLLISGCSSGKVNTNKNDFTIAPYDVKDTESSEEALAKMEESSSNGSTPIGLVLSGKTTPALNNSAIGLNVGSTISRLTNITSGHKYIVNGGLVFPYGNTGQKDFPSWVIITQNTHRGHQALDLVGDKGNGACKILSATDGKVVLAESRSDGPGNWVIVLSKGMDTKTNTPVYLGFIYMHLKEQPVVKKDQQITKGTVLGYEGSTGNSSGSHLHFQIAVSYSKDEGAAEKQLKRVISRKSIDPFYSIYGWTDEDCISAPGELGESAKSKLNKDVNQRSGGLCGHTW